jgi:flavin reductase (DIM6/NTAB) family NADH-FMN oxidoreductase RutF
MFSSNQTVSGQRKDTVVNAEETRHFVWNLATWDLREAVNITAEQFPYGVDEFERAKLTKQQAKFMDVPMVKESPVKFECEYHSTIRLPGNPPMGSVDIVIGKVVAVHIDDNIITEGILDVKKTKPIARCGYYQYAVIQDTFDMIIPNTSTSADVNYGLLGDAESNRAKNYLNNAN